MEYKKGRVVGWVRGGKVFVARLRGVGVELSCMYSRSPVVW